MSTKKRIEALIAHLNADNTSNRLRKNQRVTMLAAATSDFNEPLTDVRTTNLRRVIKHVEPEVQAMYKAWADGLDNPRWWVEHARALLVIDAEVSVDTMFTQLHVPVPGRADLQAGMYLYMKCLFWDYIHAMQTFPKD